MSRVSPAVACALLLLSSLSLPIDSTTAAPESPEIQRGPRGQMQIALTFDAGGSSECFSDLITALARAQVAGTFFIAGKWAQQNPECAKEIVQHGHEIGNHTWNHPDLTRRSDPVIREEIERTELLLLQLTGQDPRPLWRAPFGARDARVLHVVHSLGYRSIYWTIDSLDSVDPPKTPEFLHHRITSRSDAELDGAIVLMHVGEPSTAAALPGIIANLQSRGFTLVTVSRLLGLARPHRARQ